MVVICAWCKSLIRLLRGEGNVSHGMCRQCSHQHEEETPDFQELWIDVGGEAGGA